MGTDFRTEYKLDLDLNFGVYRAKRGRNYSYT